MRTFWKSVMMFGMLSMIASAVVWPAGIGYSIAAFVLGFLAYLAGRLGVWWMTT